MIETKLVLGCQPYTAICQASLIFRLDGLKSWFGLAYAYPNLRYTYYQNNQHCKIRSSRKFWVLLIFDVL